MSRFSDVIDLIKEENGTDGDGFPTVIETVRKNIFSNRKGVRSAEFYQASQQGYALEVMFVIRSIEYQGEEKIQYGGKKYIVIRTYDKGEFTELVCMNGSNRKRV